MTHDYKNTLADFNDHAQRGLVMLSDAAIEAIRSALTEAQKREWQDIGTAPRDGTPVLLYADMKDWGGCMMEVGFFHDENNEWMTTVDPTHWQPLPTPPTAASTQGE